MYCNSKSCSPAQGSNGLSKSTRRSDNLQMASRGRLGTGWHHQLSSGPGESFSPGSWRDRGPAGPLPATGRVLPPPVLGAKIGKVDLMALLVCRPRLEVLSGFKEMAADVLERNLRSNGADRLG
jgi:hypothetical protein